MADFMLSARTMNFDGRRSSWMRKLTIYTLATAGAKIAKKLRESRSEESGSVNGISREEKLTYGAHCYRVNTSERNLLSENIPLLVASFEGIFIHHSARSSESPCWHIPCEFTATRAGNSRNQKTEGRQ
jgi:hypothetical protein